MDAGERQPQVCAAGRKRIPPRGSRRRITPRSALKLSELAALTAAQLFDRSMSIDYEKLARRIVYDLDMLRAASPKERREHRELAHPTRRERLAGLWKRWLRWTRPSARSAEAAMKKQQSRSARRP